MDGQNFQNNTYEQPSSPQPQKTDALAIVSLVLGIAAILLGCCVTTYLGIALGIGGIVCAVMSKKKQKSGLATAGMVCSIIGIVFALIWIIGAAAILAWLASMGYDVSSLM